MDDIENWRTRIDAIDLKIVEILNERASCAIEIGLIKNKLGMMVHNPEREKIVLDRVRDHNRGPLDSDAVDRIFRQIIEECRRTAAAPR